MVNTERKASTMSGEISETASMTPRGDADGSGPGQNEQIPPAVDAGHEAQGEPRDYSPGPGSEHPTDRAIADPDEEL
jgi:hypothetical protein